MELEQLYALYLRSDGVSTDTREDLNNKIFFALKGPNFNANEFAVNALHKGALAVVVDEKQYANTDQNILFFNDSLFCLQDLARWHRKQLQIPIIGLTGSNGKTTSKELIRAILSQKFKTYSTKGNLNNHIGVPLSILGIRKEHEAAVIEMGANHQKEIEFLSNISQPDIGYITNFGKAHLEGFGGIEGVIKGKSELYDYLRANHRVALVNTDDPIQMEQSAGINAIYFSTDNSGQAHYMFTRVEDSGEFCQILVNGQPIQSNLVGNYNFSNLAAAAALGLHFGINPDKIKLAIESYQPQNQRSQKMDIGNQTIILDAYNANPTSMEAALRSFAQREGSTLAILGDMFELGDTAKTEHQNIINLIAELNIDSAILVGEHFGSLVPLTEQIRTFTEKNEALSFFKNNSNKFKNIIIKGSRSMRMEDFIEVFH